MNINHHSVRFRTTAGAAVAFLMLLAAAGLTVDLLVGRALSTSFDTSLLEQASDRAALLDQGASPQTLITPVGEESFVAVANQSGEIVASSIPNASESYDSAPLGMSDQVVKLPDDGEFEREEVRVAIVEAADGQRVIVGNGEDTRAETRATIRRVLFTVVPVTALAGALVAWFVTGRALGPVRRMGAELDSVADATGGNRITPPGTRDEVDDLGATINNLLDRLDQQGLARRQFVADASHELKSPLANAQAIIDTIGPAPTPADQHRVLGEVGTELHRLNGLVDDLLFLARSDEGAPRSATVFDLADVLFDEAERLARATTASIEVDNVAPVAVYADRNEITRAIRNLLENAAGFADSGITVAMHEGDGHVALRVDDDGPGIPPADRDRVFDRFARLDSARDRSRGGTGLGLSIVASIAASNGGSVSVGDAPTGGARFELNIPKANR
jgi:signal transduction histidine kinase